MTTTTTTCRRGENNAQLLSLSSYAADPSRSPVDRGRERGRDDRYARGDAHLPGRDDVIITGVDAALGWYEQTSCAPGHKNSTLPERRLPGLRRRPTVRLRAESFTVHTPAEASYSSFRSEFFTTQVSDSFSYVLFFAFSIADDLALSKSSAVFRPSLLIPFVYSGPRSPLRISIRLILRLYYWRHNITLIISP